MPQTTKRGLVALLWLAAGLSVPAQDNRATTPVLAELFTSEGCSSCPPADRLLEDLDRTQPVAGAQIVVLSEHVDYWDHLGWKDRFSSAAHTSRQESYGRRFRIESVYTPQIVIDGREQVLGSDMRAVREAVTRAAAAPKLAVAISGANRKGGSVHFRLEVAKLPGDPEQTRAEVWVALAEERAESAVGKGENSGRRMAHIAIARRFEKVGEISRSRGFTKELTWPAEPGAGRIVAVVQQPDQGRVSGVGVAKYSE